MKLIIRYLCLFFILPLSVMSQNYDVEELSVVPFTDVIKRTGKLDFKRVLNLSFKSSGYLTQLSVDEGDSFEKEQLLASLETDELTATKNSTFAQLMQAKRDVNRISKLLAKKLSSERELDIATTKVETTRASYKVAFYNLEKAQIKAPFSGVVLSRHTELGELQTPGREVLQVAAGQNNWVIKVALTGQEVNQVKLQQSVKVQLNNLGNVEGIISKIPAIANVNGHLFEIEISLPELSLQSGAIAGQLAEVVIDFSQNNFVYQLPIQALVGIDDQGSAIVMTLETGGNNYLQQSFEIYKLDNNFVYLLANIDDSPLNIVTKGWQHLTIGEH